MTTREAIEARLKATEAAISGGIAEPFSEWELEAVADLRTLLDLLSAVEAERDRLTELSEKSDTLRWKAEEVAEAAEARAEALEKERDAVYALGKTPIEQSQQSPLPRWVQTRFVHVEDFNALADRAEALARAVREWQEALRAHEKALVLLDDAVSNQLRHYLVASRREDATVTSGNLRAAGERLLALDVQESS